MIAGCVAPGPDLREPFLSNIFWDRNPCSRCAVWPGDDQALPVGKKPSSRNWAAMRAGGAVRVVVQADIGIRRQTNTQSPIFSANVKEWRESGAPRGCGKETMSPRPAGWLISGRGG